MVYKCCVENCKSNLLTSIKSEGNVSVYRFPHRQDDRERWLSVISTKTDIREKFRQYDEALIAGTKVKFPNVFVCRKHWPTNMETFTWRSKPRPIDPPSMFPLSPADQSKENRERPTKRALSSVRSVIADELGSFLKQDTLKFDDIIAKKNCNETVAFKIDDDTIGIQPRVFSPIPKFFIHVKRNLSFETYHYGSLCTVTTLSKNSITKLKRWSTFDEILRFLQDKEVSHKKKILIEQHTAMDARNVGQVKYTHEMMTRAFEYYADSRSSYSKFAQDYELPCVRTLQRITSRFGKYDESKFLNGVFSNLDNRQRKCVLMLDEIYAKAALLLHGSTMFGQAANDPSKLATTVLSMMLKAAFGGPEFIAKMLPVANLDSAFQFSETMSLIKNIDALDAEVLAVVVDGNRVNQKFFKNFTRVAGKPWLAYLPEMNKFLYLLYDYVHLLKCVRNNWLTEDNGELEYEWNGETFVAKWNILRHLYLLESSSLAKLSKLSEKTVFPKPIEKQNVQLCLNVFSYETIAALETHPLIDQADAQGTIQFLKIMLGFWKIVNTKKKGELQLFRDELRGEITDPNDDKLKILLKIADMVEKMTAPGKVRVKQLTTDTGKALAHTCRGLVELTRSLLGSGSDYVLLGWFTTDPLEKYFSKLRQGSGGTYFITVQSILEKTRILQTKLCMQLGVLIDGDPGHSCATCDRSLDELEAETMDNLIELEDSIPRETMLSLVYIAGYIEKLNKVRSMDTMFYYEKYCDYFTALDRGNLTKPTDSIVQWTVFCFIFVAQIIDHSSQVCGKFLTDQFAAISTKYSFGATLKQCRSLANTWLKNYSIMSTPRSAKEASLKEIKLN